MNILTRNIVFDKFTISISNEQYSISVDNAVDKFTMNFNDVVKFDDFTCSNIIDYEQLLLLLFTMYIHANEEQQNLIRKTIFTIVANNEECLIENLKTITKNIWIKLFKNDYVTKMFQYLNSSIKYENIMYMTLFKLCAENLQNQNYLKNMLLSINEPESLNDIIMLLNIRLTTIDYILSNLDSEVYTTSSGISDDELFVIDCIKTDIDTVFTLYVRDRSDPFFGLNIQNYTVNIYIFDNIPKHYLYYNNSRMLQTAWGTDKYDFYTSVYYEWYLPSNKIALYQNTSNIKNIRVAIISPDNIITMNNGQKFKLDIFTRNDSEHKSQSFTISRLICLYLLNCTNTDDYRLKFKSFSDFESSGGSITPKSILKIIGLIWFVIIIAIIVVIVITGLIIIKYSN